MYISDIRLVIAFAWAFVMVSEPTIGDDLETQTKALALIRATAADICNSVAQEGSSESVELSGDVKTKLGGIVQKLADLGIDGAVKYKSGQYKGVLQSELASTLQSNANCKLDVFKLLEKKMLGGGALNSSTLPPDFLARVKMGEAGKTSITYVKSLLGTPRAESDGVAEFLVGKFLIFAKYTEEAANGYPSGTIVGVKLLLAKHDANGAAVAAAAPNEIRIDGDFNSFSTAPDGKTTSRIRKDGILGTTKLNEFGLEDCNISYIGGPINNTDPQYTCTSSGTHADNFINIKLYTDMSNDSRESVWEGFTLSHYYDKIMEEQKLKSETDQAVRKLIRDRISSIYDAADKVNVSRFEGNLGVIGNSMEDKKNFVTNKIDGGIKNMTVVGIQLYVDGGDVDGEDG